MIIQYGTQKNQSIQLNNINTFYRRNTKEITFVFTNKLSQVWRFESEQECSEVYTRIIRNQGAHIDCNL